MPKDVVARDRDRSARDLPPSRRRVRVGNTDHERALVGQAAELERLDTAEDSDPAALSDARERCQSIGTRTIADPAATDDIKTALDATDRVGVRRREQTRHTQ